MHGPSAMIDHVKARFTADGVVCLSTVYPDPECPTAPGYAPGLPLRRGRFPLRDGFVTIRIFPYGVLSFAAWAMSFVAPFVPRLKPLCRWQRRSPTWRALGRSGRAAGSCRA